MHGKHLTHIKTGLRKQRRSVRQAHRQRADARRRLGHLRKVLAELGKLRTQLRLGRLQVTPDLRTPVSLFFALGAQIAFGHRGHVLFQVVAAQVAA